MVNLSAPFIQRRIATTLLTFAIMLAGIIAFRVLPVSPLPQVDFPTISVSANLPGASPDIMAATIATPLERQLGRIAGVSEMTSSSTQGSTRIIVQFELDRDIDGAARDVQAAINAARAQLPTLPTNPSWRKMNPADSPVMVLSLTSDTLDQGQVYDAASTILAQKLSQVKGIGQVSVGGGSLPAVRIELNPRALHHYEIGLEEVRTALANSNANKPKGFVEDAQRQWQIGANDQARQASAYQNLVLAYRNGAAVRLSEVGEARDSVQDLRNSGSANGRPAILAFVYRQPGANIIDAVENARATLPQLRASIPASINLEVMMERTTTIKASLRDVETTLMISVGLVIAVVFLFLRDVRATLIPSIAVPVSLIGTFSVMYLCGYSLDNLSLMALTIATGFVVDDAIVVLENIMRHLEAGLSPFAAALKGAQEVGFTVVSMSLSLIAVFIPILLMGGMIGRLFREFAVTLSVAILVSLVISLTTTPMLCAWYLRHKPQNPSAPGPSRLQQGYRRSLKWALDHPRFMMLLLALTIGLNIQLYRTVPKGFFPQQDTGRIIAMLQADQSISFQALQEKYERFVDIVRSDPAVDNVVGFIGGGQRNSGTLFIGLKPLTERDVTADQVIGRLRGKLSKIPGANLFLQPVQDIRMGGRPSNAQYQYTLQGDSLDELRQWTPRIRRALAERPELTDVNSDQQDKGLQTTLVIDRDTMARLGVTQRTTDATLYDAFGQRQVSTVFAERNQYFVIMEVDPRYAQDPSALDYLHVRSTSGKQVPLSAFARYETTAAPLAVNHQGQFPAMTLSFNLPIGKSLSDAVQVINDTMHTIGVPSSIQGGFQSTAKMFQSSMSNQPLLILAAIVAVYLVLGILYESLIHPLTILSTLPSAGVGALLGLLAVDMEFSVIALIGVLLLIGIVKKNAILIIDFALQAEREGMAPKDAILQASVLRFRPILMTTLCALLGAIPLAIGHGEGAEMRRPLGVSIAGGLLVSQLLTLYTTPVVYLYLDRFRLWSARWWQKVKN